MGVWREQFIRQINYSQNATHCGDDELESPIDDEVKDVSLFDSVDVRISVVRLKNNKTFRRVMKSCRNPSYI